jgi:tetratricopeptide (TPR) repeat protein
MTPKNLGPLAAAALCLLLPFSLCAQSMSMPGMGDAQTSSAPVSTAPMSVEKLGDVNFAVSCKPSTQAQFNRGIALLHSFGYTQAERQFKSIVAADPTCAMAHWGVAMSQYHEIWGHPEESALEVGVAQMQQASALAVNPKLKITGREISYISALSDFFSRAPVTYQTGADAYVAGMASLHADYPEDVDGAAFYALALLADVAPDDTSLTKERKALGVLLPLFAKYPDHPGLAHYIIHTCDTPALAQQGLTAAKVYAKIAPSSPHALHMPSHIFARLGMWQDDIDSNLASVRASEDDERQHEPGVAHQMHADEFLIYAYLQTGQDEKAKSLVYSLPSTGKHIDSLPGADDMKGMSPMFVNELTAIYLMETHDWAAIKALQPMAGSDPMDTWYIWWAEGVAAGHLHDAALAASALARFDDVLALMKTSGQGYRLNDMQVYRNEIAGWNAYTAGDTDGAVTALRAAADQQDKLGQAEVDLPAREMLGDLLMLLKRPADALAEYKTALTLSPNRLNGLLSAGEAAEAAGKPDQAKAFYAQAATSTNNGRDTTRIDVAHAVQMAKL